MITCSFCTAFCFSWSSNCLKKICLVLRSYTNQFAYFFRRTCLQELAPFFFKSLGDIVSGLINFLLQPKVEDFQSLLYTLTQVFPLLLFKEFFLCLFLRLYSSFPGHLAFFFYLCLLSCFYGTHPPVTFYIRYIGSKFFEALSIRKLLLYNYINYSSVACKILD